LAIGETERLAHKFTAKNGDCIFIPSGRLHAIGAGNVILETQQNSDTTYRVFDWNRVGLDGKPRTLHIEESMKSIDFNDFEPEIQSRSQLPLVSNELFELEELTIRRDQPVVALRHANRFTLIFVVDGEIAVDKRPFRAGDFFLIPASSGKTLLSANSPEALLLRIGIPLNSH
jgi:mannose-6-phosphate isomerase